MGWVLGLGFLWFRSVFAFLAAPLPTAWPIRAERFPLLFIEKKKKKTAKDRTTLRPRKKKKNCQGPDYPQTKKKKTL